MALLVASALAGLTSVAFPGSAAGQCGGGYGYGYGYSYGYEYGGCEPPHLIVIKHVIKDNGGTADAADFSMQINGVTVNGTNPFPGEEAPGTLREVGTGSYTVTETGPAGYAESDSSECSGSIALDETKTCTITNDDIQPILHVIKHVITDNGGTAVASDFTMTVTGSSPSPASFAGAESPGTTVHLNTGAYSVSETGPSGYTQTASADCSGTMALGDEKTCTITNDDQPAHLIVIKHVINNDSGHATASQFTMTINGVTATGGNTFSGQESPGTDKVVTPGSYNVTETGPSGYFATFSADCTDTIALGQTKTCTVTNNDIGPRRTIGYWKNHLSAVTLGLTLGNFVVATTNQALAVFNAANCGSSKPGDAVGCLAGQLLAAKLNLANGNSTCILPTVTKADNFLKNMSVTAGGVTATGVNYNGPGPNYNLNKNQRTVATTLASALDKYNSNQGCPNP